MRGKIDPNSILNVVDPNKSKDRILALKEINLDLIVLAWWPYIIKEPLISISRLGCLNLHPSLLPYNQGKHPYFWSIVEDVPFGVTIHFIDAGIIFQSQKRIKHSKISGKTFAITGSLIELKRSEVKKKIEEYDARLSSSISKKTDFLILGDNPGSKFEKAKELDITIINEKELLKILEINR